MKNQSKLELLCEGSINLATLAPKIGVNYYTLWRACSGKQVGTAALAKKVAKWAKCDAVDVFDMWKDAIELRIANEIDKL